MAVDPSAIPRIRGANGCALRSFAYDTLKNHPEKPDAPEHSIETDERRGEAASD